MAPDTVQLPSIAFLGTGSMARAILGGLLAPHVHVDGGIRATTRSEESAARVRDLGAIDAIATETDADANRTAVSDAALVVVAVKPGMVPALLAEIADAVRPDAVVVSVAAGVPARVFEAALPDSVAVVRTMPNTPAFVGRAVTGVSAGTRVSAEQLAEVSALFGTVGEVVEVPEEQLDALGTISGSGPAYVFRLVEALTAAAEEKGFAPDVAARLVNGTFSGALALLAASGSTPTELRVQVTSPKGTTERALAVFDDADLDGLFVRATDAALARSRELAAG